MADVSRLRRSDRAQFILVSGLLIAVVLVALVLLLNATIYTENVATRGVDSGANDALQYQETLSVGIVGLVEEENQRNHSEWGDIEANVNRGNAVLTDRLERQYVERGSVVTAEVRIDPGVRVWQEETGEFDDGTIASNVTEVRSFSIDSHELPEDNESFQIVVQNGSDEWVLSLYQEGNEVVAEAEAGTCSADVEEITPHDPDWCNGDYVWADGVDEGYEIDFVNGSATNGEYELVADGVGGDGIEANQTAFVSSATIDLTYRSSRIEYSTSESLGWEAPR
ncbi:DUF7261 family protein [Natronorarus salvus]|uniref:DUF7261 family protein n=1 Tax=Natronorarus salvus TaxID=3117733 RepID=UPI002F266ABB